MIGQRFLKEAHMFETTDFSGWPSGECKPVLELACTPAEVELRWNLKFLRDKDDLDWYSGSHVKDKNIGYIVMMRHDNSPAQGTILYVDSSVKNEVALARIRSLFDIEDHDIAWEAIET